MSGGEGGQSEAAQQPIGPSASRRRTAEPVPEGASGTAAAWFAGLDVKTFFAGSASAIEAFEHVRGALVELDQYAGKQLEVARRQATTLNSHTSAIDKQKR